MNKFIKLTRVGGGELHLGSMLITAMQSTSSDPGDQQTVIYTLGGQSWAVIETPEQIKKKLADLDKFLHFDPVYKEPKKK